jgi:hypothetical protein
VNARHSSAVNTSLGPSGSFESRTTTTPGRFPATSTQPSATIGLRSRGYGEPLDKCRRQNDDQQYYNEGECSVTAQHTEPDEPQTQVPVRELRRLRALARMASPQELAEAEEAARIEELDALEAAGRTGELSEQRARQILGIPDRRGDEKYLTSDEVRRRLGLPG